MEKLGTINFINNFTIKNPDSIPNEFMTFVPLYQLPESQRHRLYDVIRLSCSQPELKILNLLLSQIECSIFQKEQLKDVNKKYKELAKVKISMLEGNVRNEIEEDIDYGFEKLKMSASNNNSDDETYYELVDI